MIIQVTREDVMGAERCAVDNPVSRAIGRVLGGKWYVWYHATAFEMMPPGRKVRLTPAAHKLLNAYLDTGHLEPFTFETTIEGVSPQLNNHSSEDVSYLEQRQMISLPVTDSDGIQPATYVA